MHQDRVELTRSTKSVGETQRVQRDLQHVADEMGDEHGRGEDAGDAVEFEGKVTETEVATVSIFGGVILVVFKVLDFGFDCWI